MVWWLSENDYLPQFHPTQCMVRNFVLGLFSLKFYEESSISSGSIKAPFGLLYGLVELMVDTYFFKTDAEKTL